MPRKVQNSRVDDRTARRKLEVRPEPHWMVLQRDPVLHLGYRRLDKQTDGTWTARLRNSAGQYREKRLGNADDISPADGKEVLSYDQAQTRARDELAKQTAATPAMAAGPMTVEQACEDHIAYLNAEKRNGWKIEASIRKWIIPALGKRPICELTRTEIDQWKFALVRTSDTDADMERRSKDTANKNLSMLKAALNRAFSSPKNKILTDAEWRTVKPFKDVGRPRTVHLDGAQVARLLNKSDADFRKWATAYLLTGARPGELRAATASDFSRASKSVRIRDGKTGPRVVYLTTEGVEFFSGLAAGKAPDAVLLPEYDNKQHDRMIKKVAKAAKLPADTCAYSLRHTYASRALLNGLNMQLLAENMGTSVRMIEQNYGHFIEDHRRQMIEAGAIQLGLDRSNVKPMQKAAG